MNLLDRHIFKSVAGASLASVGLFAFVLMLGNAIRDLLGYMLAGQLSAATFLHLVTLLVPFVISFALPMGVLTGVLLTLGRLSADSEITAMRAAGISLRRIARPVVVFGLLGAVTGVYINFESMPRARIRYQQELHEAVRANPLSFIVPRTFNRDFPGFVIYVGEKKGALMQDFWLWELDSQNRVRQLVRARSGHFEYDETDTSLLLTLNEAQMESRNAQNPENFAEPSLVGSFEKSDQVRLPLDRLFGKSAARRKLKWLTFEQLAAEGTRLEKMKTTPANEQQIQFQRMQVKLTVSDKLNTALAILTFAIIGVPLGISVSRRETSANLGVAVLLALGYYFLTVMVNWLDKYPHLRPDLLLWVPNLLFLSLAVWMFRRIGRM